MATILACIFLEEKVILHLKNVLGCLLGVSDICECRFQPDKLYLIVYQFESQPSIHVQLPAIFFKEHYFCNQTTCGHFNMLKLFCSLIDQKTPISLLLERYENSSYLRFDHVFGRTTLFTEVPIPAHVDLEANSNINSFVSIHPKKFRDILLLLGHELAVETISNVRLTITHDSVTFSTPINEYTIANEPESLTVFGVQTNEVRTLILDLQLRRFHALVTTNDGPMVNIVNGSTTCKKGRIVMSFLNGVVISTHPPLP